MLVVPDEIWLITNAQFEVIHKLEDLQNQHKFLTKNKNLDKIKKTLDKKKNPGITIYD